MLNNTYDFQSNTKLHSHILLLQRPRNPNSNPIGTDGSGLHINSTINSTHNPLLQDRKVSSEGLWGELARCNVAWVGDYVTEVEFGDGGAGSHEAE
jgi:hypothetical protein